MRIGLGRVLSRESIVDSRYFLCRESRSQAFFNAICDDTNYKKLLCKQLETIAFRCKTIDYRLKTIDCISTIPRAINSPYIR